MSSSNFVKYDISTGRISLVGLCPTVDLYLQERSASEEIMVGSAFPDLHYIDLTDPQNPVVADRPANSALIDKVTITADGVDFATISSIAVSTRAVVTATNGVVGGEYIVDDGVLELTADTPCTLTVTLTHYRELPITFTVEAI